MRASLPFIVSDNERPAGPYGAAVLLVALICLAVLSEVFIDLDCQYLPENDIDYKNPSYVEDPCRHVRYPQLFFLTKEECAFGRAQIAAVLLGAIIGWERRHADRPAGIRTMSLVSLGACLFTINSTYGFLHGPKSWDSSRVSAAIPSGVGFLGAGLIFKEAEKDDDGMARHVVHGLTTAASVWLSAAVGIACGGELYFSAVFATVLVLVLLRFGPRIQDDEGSVDIPSSVYSQHYASLARQSTRDIEAGDDGVDEKDGNEETELLRGSMRHLKKSFLTERPRNQPTFSSLE